MDSGGCSPWLDHTRPGRVIRLASALLGFLWSSLVPRTSQETFAQAKGHPCAAGGRACAGKRVDTPKSQQQGPQDPLTGLSAFPVQMSIHKLKPSPRPAGQMSKQARQPLALGLPGLAQR